MSMFGIHDYPVFVATAVLLNLTPGPDTMFILGNSVSRGRQAGMASALGISAGCLVHTLAAALGLSAILMTSSLAFAFVKFVGAAYLIYLGIKMLISKNSADLMKGGPTSPTYWTAFRQGMITNVLNPKVALFFLALLPQFIDKAALQPVMGFMILGTTFVVTGTIWGVMLASFAAGIRKRFQHNPRFGSLLNRFSGLVFIGLGLKLALSRKP